MFIITNKDFLTKIHKIITFESFNNTFIEVSYVVNGTSPINFVKNSIK